MNDQSGNPGTKAPDTIDLSPPEPKDTGEHKLTPPEPPTPEQRRIAALEADLATKTTQVNTLFTQVSALTTQGRQMKTHLNLLTLLLAMLFLALAIITVMQRNLTFEAYQSLRTEQIRHVQIWHAPRR